MEDTKPEASREKYWHEKNIDEKVEKIGEAVEYMSKKIIICDKRIHDLLIHTHDTIGIVSRRLIIEENNEFVPWYLRNPLNKEKCKEEAL